MFSIISCVALCVFEVVYVSFFYGEHSPHAQAGLMLIFAAEASFMVKISAANLEEKRSLGKISKASRIYTSLVGIGLLGLIALATDFLQLGHFLLLWVAVFLLTACAKIGWRENKVRALLASQDAGSGLTN